MRFLPKHVNPRGDTIVEVLIALAIVSSVLAGAFLVTQKSTLAVRDGQEHGEMSQVLQGQVELVRSLALPETSDTMGVFKNSPKYFCIDTTNPAAPVRVDFLASVTSLPNVAVDDYSSYRAECRNLQTRYNVAITYDATSKIFTFTGRWDGIAGNKNEEQFVYRIYPGAAPVVPTAVTIPQAPGGGGAPSNLADVNASSCQRNPDGSCVALGPIDYHWTSYVDNKSQIAVGVTVVSCMWKWADYTGAIVETQTNSCQPGNFQKHTWAIPPSTILPYAPNPNNSCFDFPGSVTLSLVLSDGSTPFKVYPVNYPNCS